MFRCTQINGVNNAVKLFGLCSVCIWTLFIISKHIIHNQPELTQLIDKLEEIPKLSTDADLRNLPLIFIGGHQSSGTGLLRVLLDVHPMIRCGPEPVVTRQILKLRPKNRNGQDRLSQSGVTQSVLDNAIAGFIVSILKNMGPPADRLCHKDPSSYIYLRYLSELFPKAKFIHAVRDGRGAIMSTIIRRINPTYTSDNIPEALNQWTAYTSQMIEDCQHIGIHRCMTVRYECLVIKPKREIQKILNFLDLPWDEKLLNHEKYVNETSMINKYEASSVQFVKAIHKESLYAWSNSNSIIPRNLITTMHKNNSLLARLGYTSGNIPPDYEEICEVDLKL
ncbi:unnamed protein product [Schistosoma intercalatum]|nr:unnamed protein product [Schistosoma intercalatum]CAH8500302.1 unnamed protein product [Schistosoma intercalatum]